MELKQLKHLPRPGNADRLPRDRYAIMCGAMTWVSEANLVSAISNEGGSACSRAGTCAGDPREGDREDAGEDAEPLRREPHHGRPRLQGARGGSDPREVPARLLRGSIRPGGTSRR